MLLLLFDACAPYHARPYLDQVLYRFSMVANFPTDLYEYISENLRARSDLIQENKDLKLDIIIMQAKMHELMESANENKMLKELLSSSSTINSDFAVATVIAQHLEDIKKYIVVDKGRADGAYIGQAVVDTKGVIGNIIEISEHNSKVLLISDKNNAIPVENSKGNRAIVVGGDLELLQMLDITETNNFAVGQKLYTSGLGSRYMRGYPVGVISEMNAIAGKNFMEVLVKPLANLYEEKYVVLVWLNKNE